MPVGPMGAPLPSGPIPGPPPPGPGPNLPPGANIPGPNGRGPPGGAVHPSLLDPLTNNAPLQFNTAKGKPPMPIDGALDEELIGRKEIRETKGRTHCSCFIIQGQIQDFCFATLLLCIKEGVDFFCKVRKHGILTWKTTYIRLLKRIEIFKVLVLINLS